jgi:hypothetical protein
MIQHEITSTYVRANDQHGAQMTVTWATYGTNPQRYSRSCPLDWAASDCHEAAVIELLGVTADVLIDGGSTGHGSREWFVCGCSTNGSRSSHWSACVNYRERVSA